MSALGDAISSNGGSYSSSTVSDPGGGISSNGGAYANPIARQISTMTATNPDSRPAGQGSLIIVPTTGGIRQ